MGTKTKKSITELWGNMLNLLETKYHGISTYLNPPVKESELDSVEKRMGFKLPEELRELYLCNNGQGDNVMGILSGLDFLPLEELYIQWDIWRVLKEGATEEQMKVLSGFCTSFPPHTVKKIYTNTRWIPLTHDGGGNHIGIDLDPDRKGTTGQIINFGRDEGDKFVIATDLGDYLAFIINLIEERYFTICRTEDTVVITFMDGSHPLDKYREILQLENS
jgi:internalin A